MAFFNRAWREKIYMIQICWIVLYLGFLIFIARSPFVNRYFLPIVPSIMLLATPGLYWLYRKFRFTEVALYGLVIFNLFVTYKLVFDWYFYLMELLY